MSVLFVLSNIAVPFLILAYTSLVQLHQNGSFFCAKWFILILYTLLSNIMFYFWSQSGIFLIIDLVLKLGIVFIPEIVNQSLQKIIAAFHLEIIINLIRGILIPQVYLFFSWIISFVLNRLTLNEQSQFKNIIMNSLQRQSNPSAAPIIQPLLIKVQKKFNNIGIGCDLLTVNMLNQQKRQKQILKLQLANQSKVQPTLTNNTHYSSTSDLKKSNAQEGDNFGSMKKKSAYVIQKSSTDIGIVEQDDIQLNKLRKKQLSKQNNMQVRRKYKSPQLKSKQSKQESEPSMILNKLDVSQYSDMFQDQEENENEKLVAKVQTIIEIAGMSTARLQIYNIQLYSNSQIRIVSLYGRQFERHRLISMKPLKHGYYELKLEGGKVHSRKVKFRGSFESFLKYLQADN